MSIVTSAEAGEALVVVAAKLLEFDIVKGEGYAVLIREANRLKGGRGALNWRVEVDRDGGKVLFQKSFDSDRRPIFPTIAAQGVEVDQRGNVEHPFRALDIAIEIEDADGVPVSRWHVDLANSDERDGTVQSGPLFHLQYGGHVPGYRHRDEPLKEPRWCHPPMELALLCEVVAANFFPDQWQGLRQDPAWCRSIRVFERLCYTAYIEKLRSSLARNGTTALCAMWAEEWR